MLRSRSRSAKAPVKRAVLAFTRRHASGRRLALLWKAQSLGQLCASPRLLVLPHSTLPRLLSDILRSCFQVFGKTSTLKHSSAGRHRIIEGVVFLCECMLPRFDV